MRSLVELNAFLDKVSHRLAVSTDIFRCKLLTGKDATFTAEDFKDAIPGMDGNGDRYEAYTMRFILGDRYDICQVDRSLVEHVGPENAAAFMVAERLPHLEGLGIDAKTVIWDKPSHTVSNSPLADVKMIAVDLPYAPKQAAILPPSSWRKFNSGVPVSPNPNSPLFSDPHDTPKRRLALSMYPHQPADETRGLCNSELARINGVLVSQRDDAHVRLGSMQNEMLELRGTIETLMARAQALSNENHMLRIVGMASLVVSEPSKFPPAPSSGDILGHALSARNRLGLALP